jgi:hypothetical protein
MENNRKINANNRIGKLFKRKIFLVVRNALARINKVVTPMIPISYLL